MADFCLNSLLDPGYTPGGTWVQTSQPTNGFIFTIDGTEQGCLDGVDYTGDTFTAYSSNSCLTEGEYIFEYSVPGCYAPIEATIEIFDTSKEQSLPPTIFLCRDGSEVTNYDYNWMYSDGSSVDNGGSGLQEIDVDEFIKQCNGDTIDGLVYVANPITGGYVVNPAQGDNYLLQFAYLAAPGKLTTAGLSDSMQTCAELDIQKYISSSSDDPGCTDIVPQRLVIGPIIDSYDETLATCDNTLNLYDNMPSGLLNMISLACNGTGTSGGGTLALYEMSTVAVSCNLPGSTLQIFYKDLLSTGPYLPLETTTTWNATDGSQVIFQVKWKPFGSPGFICGQETVLSFDNEDCCDSTINFQISGAGIPETLTCTNLNIGITSLSDGSCECADTTVDIDLDYTVYVNNVPYITGNIDQTFTVNGNTTVNNFDIPIDFCDFITGDEIGIGWQVNTLESASGCTITGQTDSNGEQYITTVTETQSADCGCCIDDAIENCQMFFIEESAANWGITIAGTDEIYYTPNSSITDQANQDALLEYLLDAGCSSTISIELIGGSWLKIYNFNGLIDEIYSDSGNFPREADCCEEPSIVIDNLADLCEESTCFGNRGEDYRFKTGSGDCTPDVDHAVITSDIPVTWTVTDTVGSTAILSEDEYEIEIQVGSDSSVVNCNNNNINIRDFTVTANTCESTTDEIQIVFVQII